MTGEDGSAVQLEVTKSESGEASALQRAEDAVIIAGNDIVMNAGINVVDNAGDNGVPAVDTAHTSYHEVEIIDGRKVISDSVGAECSKIEGKWDGKADLHREPVVKDFMEIINNMRNNMRKDFTSTLSGWAGEHSLQYLESSYSEEEAVCTVYGQGRENEGIKGKEAIVSEPKKPQERKGDVNMKLWERKFDEEERTQIMNNDFDTEEVWDDDVHNLEGGKTNQIVS